MEILSNARKIIASLTWRQITYNGCNNVKKGRKISIYLTNVKRRTWGKFPIILNISLI